MVVPRGLGEIFHGVFGPGAESASMADSQAFPEADRRLAAYLAAQEIALIDAGGMEMDSAGFHLIFPSDAGDPDLKNPALFPWPGENTVRRWGYWPARPRYELAYHAYDDVLGRNSHVVNVSFNSVVPTALFSYSMIDEEPIGTVAILGHASTDALVALRKLLAPLATGPEQTTDWYGIMRPTGDPWTTKRIVLVADDVAFRPIDISQAVAEFDQGLISEKTFVLADGLTFEEAMDFLSRLN